MVQDYVVRSLKQPSLKPEPNRIKIERNKEIKVRFSQKMRIRKKKKEKKRKQERELTLSTNKPNNPLVTKVAE